MFVKKVFEKFPETYTCRTIKSASLTTVHTRAAIDVGTQRTPDRLRSGARPAVCDGPPCLYGQLCRQVAA